MTHFLHFNVPALSDQHYLSQWNPKLRLVSKWVLSAHIWLYHTYINILLCLDRSRLQAVNCPVIKCDHRAQISGRGKCEIGICTHRTLIRTVAFMYWSLFRFREWPSRWAGRHGPQLPIIHILSFMEALTCGADLLLTQSRFLSGHRAVYTLVRQHN